MFTTKNKPKPPQHLHFVNFWAKPQYPKYAMRMFLPKDAKEVHDDTIPWEYSRALIKACIKVAGGEVISFDSATHENWMFSRDIGFVLEDERTIFTSDHFLEEIFSSQALLNAISHKFKYKVTHISNGRFEGGGLFYVPQHKVLLFGILPDDDEKDSDFNKRNKLLNIGFQELSHELKPKNIKVMPVKFKDVCISETNHEFYYHLDCIMQLLPDGRLLVLNKELITEESWKELKGIFGDKLIDLEYKDYATKPVMLNFIPVQNGDRITCVSTQLPDELFEKLRSLNLGIIMPDMLDGKSKFCEPDLCQQVAESLREDGFLHVDPENLLEAAWRRKDLPHLGNTHDIPALPLDNTLRQFILGYGGPHCLTLEVKEPAELLMRKVLSFR